MYSDLYVMFLKLIESKKNKKKINYVQELSNCRNEQAKINVEEQHSSLISDRIAESCHELSPT